MVENISFLADVMTETIIHLSKKMVILGSTANAPD